MRAGAHRALWACTALALAACRRDDAAPPLAPPAPSVDAGIVDGAVDAGLAAGPRACARPPCPEIVRFTARPSRVSKRVPAELTAVFSGASATIDHGVGLVTSGVPVNTAPLSVTTSFRLTVVSASGESVSALLDIEVKRELFVSNATSHSITVFDEDAVGNVAPKRTIIGANTTLANDLPLFVTGDEIYVANFSASAIAVFDANASGDVPPRRTIEGAATTLYRPAGIFVSGAEIFVGDSTDGVKVWNVGDAGDVAPRRVIKSAGPPLQMTAGTYTDGTELYVADYLAKTVVVLPKAAAGAVVPIRTFALPGLDGGAIGLFIRDGELFVMDGYSNEVVTFDKATGKQLRRVKLAGTTPDYVGQCTIVGVDLVCSDYFSNRVVIFPVAADGPLAPTRLLAGALTGIGEPLGVFLY